MSYLTLPTTLGELAASIGGVPEGEVGTPILCVRGLDNATPGSIVRVDHARKLPQALQGAAAALLIPDSFPPVEKPSIRVASTRLAFLRCLSAIHPEEPCDTGIHPTAVVEEGVAMGDGCRIEAHAVVSQGSVLGAGVRIGAGAFVGRNCRLGDGCRLFPNVVLNDDTVLASRVRIHSGTVIGADGFGYEWDGSAHVRIPQIGHVEIEDDVEVGANTTIDRATTGVTIIGAGTRIDNLVQIAHNVRTGRHCVIVSQVGIAGSTTLGNGVVLAGQTGVKDHVVIGDGVRAGGRSGIWGNQPAGAVISGHPARPHAEDLRIQALSGELPAWRKRLKELEERLARLEARAADPDDA